MKIKNSIYLLIIIIAMSSITGIGQGAKKAPANSNKNIIRKAFDSWINGTGSFFDLLSEDMQWTITGSTPFSKTYTSKKQFMDEVIHPLNQRLSKKIIPAVQALYAEDDVVIVLWDGTAEARDGKPYNMSYSWFLQMKNGKIISVVAFLDGIVFTDIMTRAL